MKNNSEINLYSRDEIIELLKLKDRLVFVDTGVEEVIAKYEDIPDIIVDFYNKFQFPDLTIYDFENEEKIITTFGPFLNKCKPEVREDIIERLVGLQKEELEIKDYKVISEEDLAAYFNSLEGVKEMKQSILSEKQQYDEELDLLYRKGLIDIDELDEMQRQNRNTQER